MPVVNITKATRICSRDMDGRKIHILCFKWMQCAQGKRRQEMTLNWNIFMTNIFNSHVTDLTGIIEVQLNLYNWKLMEVVFRKKSALWSGNFVNMRIWRWQRLWLCFLIFYTLFFPFYSTLYSSLCHSCSHSYFLFLFFSLRRSNPPSSLTIILKQRARDISVRHVCVAAFRRFNNLNDFNKTWYNYWNPSSLCRIRHFPTFTDKNMPDARICDVGATVRNGSHNIGFTRPSTIQRSC
jgi:hypothetical protein